MRTSTKIWLKVIRNGAIAGGVVGLLWSSGLLPVIGMFVGRSRSPVPDWSGHEFDPGYLHRLWTYSVSGVAIGILIACLLSLNKLLRYLIAYTGPDDSAEPPADKRGQS